MSLIEIVTLTNQLVSGLSNLGFSLSQVAAMQQLAADEGRELELEDFKKLRDEARAKLDSLDQAIQEADEEES